MFATFLNNFILLKCTVFIYYIAVYDFCFHFFCFPVSFHFHYSFYYLYFCEVFTFSVPFCLKFFCVISAFFFLFSIVLISLCVEKKHSLIVFYKILDFFFCISTKGLLVIM